MLFCVFILRVIVYCVCMYVCMYVMQRSKPQVYVCTVAKV